MPGLNVTGIESEPMDGDEVGEYPVVDEGVRDMRLDEGGDEQETVEGDKDDHLEEEDSVAEAASRDTKISAARDDDVGRIEVDAPVVGIEDDGDGEQCSTCTTPIDRPLLPFIQARRHYIPAMEVTSRLMGPTRIIYGHHIRSSNNGVWFAHRHRSIALVNSQENHVPPK